MALGEKKGCATNSFLSHVGRTVDHEHLHADVVEATGGRSPDLGSGPGADSPVSVQLQDRRCVFFY